ncbi:hypothetical protein [Desulfopila aestuarii]|nr:hypothetical protein [Desulfopila aestuarii]
MMTGRRLCGIYARIIPKCSFPTVQVVEEAIVDYEIQEIKEKIGVRTEVDDLCDMLKKANGPKGYYLYTGKKDGVEVPERRPAERYDIE